MQDPISELMLNWYDVHGRDLPWRARGSERADPYHVWLSEIMLQQTTVVTVGPYFEKFLSRWPRISDLAAADIDDVLTAWAGLGYYARARNLHKCAITVTDAYGGRFPRSAAELIKLPGIGPYTAAAVSAIAFDQPAVVVDGNIERVIARLFCLKTPLPKVKAEIYRHGSRLTPQRRAGDYCQSLMDLGATICTPRQPKCDSCPLQRQCAAFRANDMQTYPVRAARKPKPTRHGFIFWISNPEGEILLRRRPEKGLLGGMMEFPSSDWQELEIGQAAAIHKLGDVIQVRADAIRSDFARVKHSFTHFHLYLSPLAIGVEADVELSDPECRWIHPDRFSDHALPTLMRKVATAVGETP